MNDVRTKYSDNGALATAIFDTALGMNIEQSLEELADQAAIASNGWKGTPRPSDLLSELHMVRARLDQAIYLTKQAMGFEVASIMTPNIAEIVKQGLSFADEAPDAPEPEA